MTAHWYRMTGAVATLARLLLAAVLLGVASPAPALAQAQERAQLFVTNEDGFGRLVLSFTNSDELPVYKIRNDNGVLAIEFEKPIEFTLPDVAVTLPDYVSVARIDPDNKGIRFGLRTTLSVHHMEAGEKLFVDLMPQDWQGLPPGLPPSVVADLATRAKDAELRAEQKRKAEEVLNLRPVATLRVGRNPTFLRIEFNWNVPTEGKFKLDGDGLLDFDWPVPVDLYPLKSDLPPEILDVANSVDADGSHIRMKVAEGVLPRFYQNSDRQFVIDVDIVKPKPAEGEAAAVPEADHGAPVAVEDIVGHDGSEPGVEAGHVGAHAAVTPTVSTVGDTVRVAFPFDEDTAAAVFRRGDTVWMLFDTALPINQPEKSEPLSAIASAFSVIPAGDTQVVRLDLSVNRLATLGSEGRAWVLSLGDVLLNPTEPLPLNRRRDDAGLFEMTADLQKPSRVHQFRDPVVGDMLNVVTAFPPARGLLRPLSYVDFSALSSIQGLVVKPERDEVKIDLTATMAVIHADGGLELSALEQSRSAGTAVAAAQRAGFIDLIAPQEADPGQFGAVREDLTTKAAEAEGAARDIARLELARFFLANQFAEEAIGVLNVLAAEIKSDDLKKPARLSLGIADTLAHRPKEAMEILSSPAFGDEPDATMWRTISHVELNEFAAARLDAMASESVIESYPRWVKQAFLFAATRAALETNDFSLAQRYLGMLDFAKLDPEEVTYYQLFTGRISEASDRVDEAIDTYGQVIAADFRPTRAEAVYRTLLLLDKAGRLDVAKATETLSAEVLLWRGDTLEAQMQRLLADLYFRHHDYRLGFETVRDAVKYFPDNDASNTLMAQAQDVFTKLYLDGVADQMAPVDALSIYYDFREMTPPGARGDEMIRNLTRRLVKVDLLAQAGDLLEYQIDNRLKGVAQAQVAADLAVIRIADRNPEAALRVLNRTRLADLSPTLERQRRILEARALIDAGRQDLAIDLIRKLTGRDADLLRVEGLWKGKQYQAASELLEVVYSPSDPADVLSQPARMNIVKAAVGFVLAGDRLGLSRLRSKFGEQLSKTAEWPMFDFVTSEVAPQSVEFKQVAREVSGLDSVNAFLTSYRQMYGESDGTTPVTATPPKTDL